MKNKNNKPDAVVFDTQSQTYNASILPYATGVGAPQISPPDVSSWKNTQVQAANHEFKAQFNALKDQYEKMMASYAFNNRVYNAKFSFEPIIGETYFLYQTKTGEDFLSLIPPSQCNFNFQASCLLGPDKMWQEKTEESH
ncbi:MAG: DUF2452 domain-containing protein [Flavobacteriaceae bacterium]|jgi:hypothetical protein|nr:DUF2452 domain-containing protein [Flavobacteriaceae bacterium LSUCC0859]MCI4642025.1 DUF2452 domain-containing protein [Flavobacteriaceae bacterium]MCI5087595.1 DUF2452 domain-containing protein [Flavobacteriaceae bacterium]CAI8199435.1 MAG: Uncharacterised protein [SAR116 cluster bacterium]